MEHAPAQPVPGQSDPDHHASWMRPLAESG
jgi:hypothetical protein